ncbi:hypothetical protein Tel_07680 [Candidatus Tenderia electrophaga]|jgi:PAS domain S-box-containing protein|uniref:histidine kinase n=1 Tax=Candidatus Tenderia electrophaga TaxID=1748243 RepID=A0A0S2TD61_9GAMM|nr:hypothetical protein Tel_07680 [Candidatus Tenderia electrophaga]
MPLSATDGGWLRQLIDATPIGLVVVSRDGHIMVTNTELEHQFGYSRAELLGKQVEMLLPERYQNSHHGLRGDYSRTPQKRPMGIGRELFGRRKDGMEFPIEIGLNPIETETGPAVIASICDISVRTRLHTNFRQMVEASPVGTLMIDGDGRIGFVNAKLCQLFGYEENQLIGEKLEVLLPPHFRNGHVELRNAFFENPDARAMGPGRDLSGLRKDGSEFAVEVGLSPVYTEDGIAVVAAVTDISARKAMELHLRKLNEDLDEFSYVASHDLRAPLQGIASLVEWISEDIGDGGAPEVLNKLERVRQRINRMECLIEDLLAYARAGQRSSESRDIDVLVLLKNIVELVEIPARFTVTLDSEVGHINTASIPLETVLRNLIGNAVKHHDRETGVVAVQVYAEGLFCVFSVTDDGPGIPRAAHERIFKLFQALNSQSREHAGVGLAIAKRLVESHGGRIEVRSGQGGRGTRFRFWWPCMAT